MGGNGAMAIPRMAKVEIIPERSIVSGIGTVVQPFVPGALNAKAKNAATARKANATR